MNRHFSHFSFGFRIARAFGIFLFLGTIASPAFAYAAGLSVQALSPGQNVGVGQTVFFSVAQTGLTNPVYSVSDSFSGSTVSGGNLSLSGGFTWTPGPGDVGTHTITVSAHDTYGNIASVSQGITVAQAVSAFVQGLSPGNSVSAGVPVSFSVGTSGFTYPTYSLSDSFAPAMGGVSTIASTMLNANGGFSWTPGVGDLGTHTLTITVSDAYNGALKTTASVPIMIISTSTMIASAPSPDGTINPGQNVSFTAYSSGLNYPSFTVSDSFQGSSVTNANVNSAGSFSWTPTNNDIGTHTIRITARDASGQFAVASRDINVENLSVGLDSLDPANAAVIVGQPVTFHVPTAGFTGVQFSVQDSFSGSSVVAYGLNAAGYFNWTPVAYDVGKHIITVTAFDNRGHSGQAKQQIDVYATSADRQEGLATRGAVFSEAGMPSSQASSASAPATASVPATVPVKTPAPASGSFTSYLKRGSSGAQVLALQKLLKKQGFLSAAPNGYYGPATEAAVKKFQKKNKISQLGVVGPATRAVLNKAN